MRILHLGKYYPPVAGGMERFLADLVEAQRAAGHDVTVLVHESRPGEGREDPPWLLRCPVWFRMVFTPVSPAFASWLRRAIRTHKPDVLHIHVPNVSAFWALFWPCARKLPWIVHWQSDIERSKLALKLAYPHYRMFERALLEGAETVIASSPQYLEGSTPLKPWRHKVRIVPLGISAARLPMPEPDELPPWPASGLRILAVGRLTYYKGFPTLLRAVAGIEGLQLVIVGEGEERPMLEGILAEARRPSNVRLAGGLGDAALRGFLASCDVMALPSIERTESFGIALLEAMRYGKPLMVSDLPGSGITYVGRAGQNAVHVAPNDVPAWRAALQELAASPARRRLLGHLGRERFEREFDIAAIEPRITEIYRLAMKVEAEEALAQRAGNHDDIEAPEKNAPMRADRLLVVIPALNEADCIGDVILQARATHTADVLVIDDGSTDETAAVAIAAGAHVIRAPLWQGAWGAIQTGMRYAIRHGYGAVVTMDADGQHEPAQLPLLIEAARNADVVIAACPSRGSRMRHVAWAYFRFLTGLSFDDLTSGFRYYNVDACRLLASEEATLLDYQDVGVLLLLRRAGLRIAEVAVSMNPRRSGASRVFSSWWTVARYMAETTLLALARWNPRRRNGALAAAQERR
jgi:glycosyltransferase involved in cell wall biosynthesis